MPLPKDTKKSFINKATKRWGNRYDYSLVQYINSRTSVIIICNKHKSSFKQTPKAHFSAKHHCCPQCYREVTGSFQNEWRSLNKSKKDKLSTSQFTPIIKNVFRG